MVQFTGPDVLTPAHSAYKSVRSPQWTILTEKVLPAVACWRRRIRTRSQDYIIHTTLYLIVFQW